MMGWICPMGFSLPTLALDYRAKRRVLSVDIKKTMDSFQDHMGP
jgi:hypothetical protein